MNRFLIAAAAALLSSPAAANLRSVTVDSELAAHVGYSDLDLASAKDRQALVGRIRFAANRVCDPDDFNYPYRSDRRCLRVAIAGGVAQMEEVVTQLAQR